MPPGEVGPWSAMEVAALRLRNIQYAAILRTPGEILVSIFRQVIKTSPDYVEAVQLITSICHHLRALVFGTPELWGFVCMSGTLGPLFLERCQWNPISVVPYFYEGGNQRNARLYACLNYWKSVPISHLTRVELIEFCGTRENFAAVSWIFNYHMPNLETLTLASGPLMVGAIPYLEEDPDIWNINPSTQRTLKDVHLQHIFIPWASNVFYGLSTLYLDYRGFSPDVVPIPMDAFLEVLSRSPRLEKCSLYFAIPRCHSKESLQDLRPTRTVNFPLLEELTMFDETLSLAYLLRHLCLPTTTKTLLKVDTSPDELGGLLSTLFPPGSNATFDSPHQMALEQPYPERRPALAIGPIRVQYLDEWDDESVDDPNHITHMTFAFPLLEAAHRAGPSVHILKIRLDCGLVIQPAVMKVILESLPNLDELVCQPLGKLEDHQWPRFWEVLCHTGGSGLICPNLRTLRIVDMQGVPPDSVTCLATRWKLERPLGVFHIRVGNCELSLAQHTIAYLRPFVAQLVFEIIGDEGEVVSSTCLRTKPCH